LQPARNQSQFTARCIVPKKTRPHTRQFSAFFVWGGTDRSRQASAEATSGGYRGTAQEDKMQVSIRIPESVIPEIFQ
jgi:hypothetical protein